MGKGGLDLSALLRAVEVQRVDSLAEPPPIPCRGYEINTPNAHEYDCAYDAAGAITCEDCIVNGGCFDPRTGKRYRGRRRDRTRDR